MQSDKKRQNKPLQTRVELKDKVSKNSSLLSFGWANELLEYTILILFTIIVNSNEQNMIFQDR
jgi:hypothetical protein